MYLLIQCWCKLNNFEWTVGRAGNKNKVDIKFSVQENSKMQFFPCMEGLIKWNI